MTMTNWKSLLAVIAASTLAMSGCSGADGKDGVNGSNGTAGTDGQDGQDGATGPTGPTGPTGATGPTGPAGQDLVESAKAESCVVCHPTAGALHQADYNNFADGIKPATTKFAVTNVALAITAGTNAGTSKATVTFNLSKGGVPFSAAASTLKQKTFYFVTYDATTGTFPTPAYNQPANVDPDGTVGGQDAASVVNFSFGSMTLVDAATGAWKMTKDNLSADPVATATNAFVYGYFGDANVAGLEGNLNPGGRHYALMDNMVSVAKVVKGTVDYTSTVTVSGCEKCHGAPYSKHGYRQATVAGLNDIVACKACHTDFRRGTDAGWYLIADDKAAFAAQAGVLTAAQKAKYAYTANVMNDTHNSHAFEFAYPQSISNCNTCHEGKLNLILTDANFTPATCKSCHPVTGTGGTDAKRAPALKSIIPAAVAAFHPADLYTTVAENACNGCHKAGGSGKTFSQIHVGYNKLASNGTTKYADTVKMSVDTATFDSATNKLTVAFKVTGAVATAIVKPTVVMSLYGYDTKDFLVSGHGSQPAPDSKRNLEWTEAATGNSPRLAVTPLAAAGITSWTAVADLTLWASKLADGSVKRIEIGLLPAVGLDQTKAPDNAATLTGGAVNPNYNPYIAATGETRTFDLVAKALVADASSYGKAIVDPAKCNKCHENLGMTFHTPAYGSAGVVGCRLCHVVGSGGSHLEMQSRSIDSYVHSIHSMQPFDMASINFADPVAKLEYEEHVDSVYPNFSIKNCESCHYAGTYEVPDQSRSMLSVQSASATLTGWDRNIGVVPSYVTGPASRACGGCHRAQLIKEDEAATLAAFNEHAHSNGTLLVSTTGVWDAAVAKIMALFK